MLHPKVDGVWMSEIGPFGDVSYSENWLHGCETAKWSMNPGTRHRALRPGASVVIYEAGLPLWSGLLSEPARDGSMDAFGLWVRGSGVLAIDYTAAPITAPQTSVDAAIARGAVPWRRVAAMFDAPVGETDPALTLNALLDRYSETSGGKWRVNHLGNVEVLTDPASPSWALLLTEDLWSASGDDYVTHLNTYWMDGVGTFDSDIFTTADSAAAAALWGVSEAFLDLTGGDDPSKGLGVISDGDAAAYAAAKLAQTGPRLVLSESISLGAGQLRTLGDTPVGWAGVHAGQSVRLWGIPDRSRAAMNLHTDFTIGRIERTDAALTLAPQGLPPRNTRDVIAALSA